MYKIGAVSCPQYGMKRLHCKATNFLEEQADPLVIWLPAKLMRIWHCSFLILEAVICHFCGSRHLVLQEPHK